MVDPYYANVSLLLPMNGANNGTVFTDYSPTPKTITRNGDTKTVTTQYKYYGSSGYFDGSGDYLSLAAASSLNTFGTGDFTIESWVYLNSIGATRVIQSAYVTWSSAVTYYWDVSSTGIVRFYAGNSIPIQIASAVALTAAAWHHVAVVRSSGTTAIYLNGVQSGTTHTGSVNIASSATLRIGYETGGGTTYWLGNMQDTRNTPGIARYTSNFTPPSRLLQGISGTVLNTTGAPCARTVYVYDNATGMYLGTATSDPTTGAYEVLCNASGNEVFRVVKANEPTLYTHIIDRVFPG